MKTTTSKDGTVLAYDVHGSGPALVYVTGASCFRSFMPIVQDVKQFAREFTVYNYDRRGRGDSGNTLPWTVEREVEDIEAMIDAAGGKACLYGHSSGAVLALEAALRLGDKVQKVVLYDASYVHDETEKAEYEVLGQAVHKLLEEGKKAEAMRAFLKGIGMPKAFVFLLPLFPGWRTMKALAPTLAYDIALTRDVPPVERAAGVAVPTHVMVGQKSPAGLHDVAGQLAKAIPNARFTELAGQDHMVGAKVLLPRLVEFLKR
ncbi:alpha/beta hydrolase [Corallococcus sp. BB11-1]|uniref:alpha/beta fold hydrolase n=1 Tax=Corallococcus sp. BB11-1 TaxID=2996783 RepID=UPI0022720FC2|nr:alpha/beta hydrolase [Corallococcus sp. BB11-1]MCY1033463.1 alpha/beta hydrolase [Corallococcus sp. BB11-1]